mgnify:CR=1 FL=1
MLKRKENCQKSRNWLKNKKVKKKWSKKYVKQRVKNQKVFGWINVFSVWPINGAETDERWPNNCGKEPTSKNIRSYPDVEFYGLRKRRKNIYLTDKIARGFS